MAAGAPDFSGHGIRFPFHPDQSDPLDELVLNPMAGGAGRVCFLVMASDTTGPIHDDLPVFIRIYMAIVTGNRLRKVPSVGKVNVIDPDLGVQKASMTLDACGMRRLLHPRQRDGPLGMALHTGGLLPLMAFKTSLFWGPEGGRNLGVMIDIVMAGDTGIV